MEADPYRDRYRDDDQPVIAPAREGDLFYSFVLRSAPARLALALLLLLVLIVLAPAVSRQVRSERLAADPTPENLQRALALEPDRAEYHNLLGEAYLFSLAHYDPPLAVQSFRRAVELNPQRAGYWLNLARAYEGEGLSADSVRCVETARRLDPRNPVLAWAQGNVYATAGRIIPALEAWRDTVDSDATYAAQAFDVGWKLAPDPQVLLDHLVPSNNAMDFRFLDYLLRNRLSDGTPAWRRILRRGQTFELELARGYVDGLLFQGSDHDSRWKGFQAANKAWIQLLALNAPERSVPAVSPENRIFNAGFEHEFLGLGFDWRWHGGTGVTMSLDHSDFTEGRRSLCFTFDGAENLHFNTFYQVVPVEPGKRYELTAKVKAEGISGSSGPRLRVVGDSTPGPVLLDVAGQEIFRTKGWIQERLEFTAPGGAFLVRVMLWRPPSTRFGAKIRGSICIDEMNLRPLTGKEAE